MEKIITTNNNLGEDRVFTCPRCTKRFQRETGKMFTCKTCGDTSNSCKHICCPHCGYSWNVKS